MSEDAQGESVQQEAQLRKRRSRSFGDYIDHKSQMRVIRRHDGLQSPLTIPELPSSKGQQDTAHHLNESDYGAYTEDEHYVDPSSTIKTWSTIKQNGELNQPLTPIDQENGRQGGVVVDEDGDDDVGNSDDESNPFYISVLYGLINATIVLPVVMSFGNIIYRDDAFRDYMPVLIKLTLVSGFVHQLCFSSLSSLKFAVGSVQDAGLIFLSSMAKDMADFCHKQGYDDTTMLATVTVGLALAAATLGVGLVIIAKLKLAGYVQMLPTCVVAGYLAYIGYFVGYSGLGIMAGQSALTLHILVENWLYILPGILGGVFIYFSVQRLRHVAVLPMCIAILLLAFYIGLAVTGSSIDQATHNGWIRRTEEAPMLWHTWDYIKLDRVAWEALPQLWMTELAMLFVVALSSSLDVAAIELEMKHPLDYNKELSMVGISNMVSGLTCGYTGSYIFSQSIFSLRIGIRSRVAGFALAFFQLLVIVLPFPILSYVPNFFYGSLLSMICIDLMYEWMWDFRGKATVAEYLVALCTFLLIYFLGVEYGILAGVGLYVVCRQISLDVGELKQIQPLDIQLQDDQSNDSEAECLLHHGDGKELYQATTQ